MKPWFLILIFQLICSNANCQMIAKKWVAGNDTIIMYGDDSDDVKLTGTSCFGKVSYFFTGSIIEKKNKFILENTFNQRKFSKSSCQILKCEPITNSDSKLYIHISVTDSSMSLPFASVLFRENSDFKFIEKSCDSLGIIDFSLNLMPFDSTIKVAYLGYHPAIIMIPENGSYCINVQLFPESFMYLNYNTLSVKKKKQKTLILKDPNTRKKIVFKPL